MRYVKHDEGAVAYQVWGDGAVDVLVMTNWPTSVDNIWEHPGRVRFMTIHGTLARVIRLDPRGLGGPLTCPRSSSPPTALLEVKTPDGCVTLPDGLVDCDGRVARTTWAHSIVPTLGFGLVRFFCEAAFSDTSCVDHEMPCPEKDLYALCRITYTFRGTSSTDPDNDIVSWSLDFGDGTSASGDWATNPPIEISHEYLIHYCPTCPRAPATLTVTDSVGNSHSDAQLAVHQFPD